MWRLVPEGSPRRRCAYSYTLFVDGDPGRRLRTAWNVRDSDATLILTNGQPSGGTALTITLADRAAKPFLVIDLLQPEEEVTVQRWFSETTPEILNIAGPRESQQPGIYACAYDYLKRLLSSKASA